MKFKLTSLWYQPRLHPVTLLLRPLAFLFGLCVALRRLFYRSGFWQVHSFSIPVIVVGNLTVGGTGKTPFVIWLANFLQAQGYRPGIVSRGVGGQKHRIPYHVRQDDSAGKVGDEALLLVSQTDCPLVIGVDRVACVRELMKTSSCNIVISDDGLQHYRLGRTLEIVMVDNERKLGNQQLLPAGPLREKKERLQAADFVVMHGGSVHDDYTMQLEPLEWVSLNDPESRFSFTAFPGKRIHAVAGIGHPQRFFAMLKSAGLQFVPHVFPDHHAYQPRDLDIAEAGSIVMTEKDAVKCRVFADDRAFYLKVAAVVNERFKTDFLSVLQNVIRLSGSCQGDSLSCSQAPREQ